MADAEHWLGTLSGQPDGDGTTFSLLVELSNAEYDDLSESITALHRLTTPFNYLLVERNFLDLESVHKFVSITISLGRQFASADRHQLHDSLMTSAANWLTAMRLFLDHALTDLRRRFGRKSPQAIAFESAKAAAGDALLGFRFCERLRNYVQHCGWPPARISIRPVPTGASAVATQLVDLHLNRDELLRAYNEWGDVEADLKQMPETFSLLPLGREAMEGIGRIYRVLLDIELDEALEKCGALADALDRIGDAEGIPFVCATTGDLQGPMSMSPRPFDADLVRALCSVANGDAPRSGLFSSRTTVPPPLDPATVKESFHRDSRGVQVLAAWLQEKGGTPAFQQVIDDLVQADGGVEPLVAGLVRVSTVLLHVCAAALATSPKGFLAGLLDLYAEHDVSDDFT